ncbi:trace amine-associated receptor 4-like [Hyla sarda]|uniref:trace amine-associated receptor 4-like n=1 Tax=Hyla sarda TaxID=327740 RepID=UPI0024C265F2|nr:trace amine-associated receptor 4-like [Hyla sarda]
MNSCSHFLNSTCSSKNRSLSSYLALYMVMSGAMVLTVLGNLMVIISVSHFKQLHTPTNALILSLATADFLVGLMVMPYSMVRSVTSCWYFGDLFCKLHSCFDMMLCTSSIFHLFFISVDRYYAICHPLHYYKKMSVPMIQTFLFVSWSGPCLYSFGLILSDIHTEGIYHYVVTLSCTGLCTLVLNKLWGTISSLICFFIPGILMIGIYIHIFSIARKQAKSISNHTYPLSGKKTTCNKKHMNMENKAARTLSLVMGVFILCWMPFFTITVIDPFMNFSTSEDLYNIVLWLGYFNSTLNPIIYALFYPWFKKSFDYIVTGAIFHQGSSSIHVMTGV